MDTLYAKDGSLLKRRRKKFSSKMVDRDAFWNGTYLPTYLPKC